METGPYLVFQLVLLHYLNHWDLPTLACNRLRFNRVLHHVHVLYAMSNMAGIGVIQYIQYEGLFCHAISGENLGQLEYFAVGAIFQFVVRRWREAFHYVNLSNIFCKQEFHSINLSNVGFFIAI